MKDENYKGDCTDCKHIGKFIAAKDKPFVGEEWPCTVCNSWNHQKFESAEPETDE